jgi:hypothetical protein
MTLFRSKPGTAPTKTVEASKDEAKQMDNASIDG